MSSSSSVQFSYDGVNAGRSIILLKIECPQLSKPKAKGGNGKELKLHQVTEYRKNLGRNYRVSRGQFSSGQ